MLAMIGLAQLDPGDLGDGVPLVGRLQRPGEQGVFRDRLRSMGWAPSTPLREGVARAYAWFVENEAMFRG